MTREEAKRILRINRPVIRWTNVSTERYIEAFDMAISALSEDKEESKHGHWIEHDVYDECSVCLAKKDNLIRGEFNFCPKCGADMREPKGEKGTE